MDGTGNEKMNPHQLKALKTKIEGLDVRIARTTTALETAIQKMEQVKSELAALTHQRNALFGAYVTASGISSVQKVDAIVTAQNVSTEDSPDENSLQEHPSSPEPSHTNEEGTM